MAPLPAKHGHGRFRRHLQYLHVRRQHFQRLTRVQMKFRNGHFRETRWLHFSHILAQMPRRLPCIVSNSSTDEMGPKQCDDAPGKRPSKLFCVLVRSSPHIPDHSFPDNCTRLKRNISRSFVWLRDGEKQTWMSCAHRPSRARMLTQWSDACPWSSATGNHRKAEHQSVECLTKGLPNDGLAMKNEQCHGPEEDHHDVSFPDS